MIGFTLYVAEWSKASKDVEELISSFGEQFKLPEIVISRRENSEADHDARAVRIYPTFVKTVDGVEVSRSVGPMDLIALVESTKE